MTDESTGPSGNDADSRIARERAMIVDAKSRGTGPKLWAYTKLSGPGWLQSAITLGGGSLAGSLYLGVLAGSTAMWWQPLAMLMGVIMLSAIGYVALSTGERPFDAINKHVSPVLGWGWAIATLMANLVWCMPQYSLGTAALRQNLAPEAMGTLSPWVAVAVLFVVTGIVIVSYDSGSTGVRIFEWVLKAMVGVVVVSFFAVVVRMTMNGNLDWSAIFAGFVPNFQTLGTPAPAFEAVLAETGQYRDFWSQRIVADQQQVMITAAATAVGINMTFLLPYSMLRKGWDRQFRGLAIFDLSTGLFVPYLLATSCVVIAAAAQFHAVEGEGLVPELTTDGEVADEQLAGRYASVLDTRLERELGERESAALSPEEREQRRAALPLAERRVAAMIVQRDAFDLAAALDRLTGEGTAQLVFGVGVLGMAVSTIIILMLINGFVLTEICNMPGNKALHLAGCFLASIVGAWGSQELWTGAARTWLAVPTSNFGMMLLPIAYVTFVFLMNSRSLLGNDKLSGARLFRWNVLMGLATVFATACCIWAINLKTTPRWGVEERVWIFGGLAAFLLLAIAVHLARGKGAANEPEA